ncbi:MAG: hypothetical protein SFU99_21660 [Saprospiraceae bacterium]|nr:hypothetical protein [Saprospiraceae bacterium]
MAKRKNYEDDLNKVLKHLNTINDLKEKIKYLIEVKTRYDQNEDDFSHWGITFSQQCQFEIDKYLSFLDLEGTPIELPNPEFTTARQVLALYYLLNYAKATTATADKTNFARFTQFLTGKEAGNSTIRNTNIYKRWKDVFSNSERKNIQDLQYIRPFFEKLGLLEVVKMIDNDINNADAQES